MRILSIRSGESSLTELRRILSDKGAAALYRGLPPILLKEVPFVVTKFVVFEQVYEALASAFPEWGDSSALAFPLLAGAVAGASGILASQPADVVLTRTNEDGATLGGSVAAVLAEPGLVLQGLAPRLLFGVLLATLQFVIYTQLREIAGVSKADLTLVYDALAILRG